MEATEVLSLDAHIPKFEQQCFPTNRIKGLSVVDEARVQPLLGAGYVLLDTGCEGKDMISCHCILAESELVHSVWVVDTSEGNQALKEYTGKQLTEIASSTAMAQ